MRRLYSLIWWLILPLAIARLYIRGRKEPGYRQHIPERLGFFPPVASPKQRIWVHAVSVGETRAAEPLVRALLSRYPDCDILLTHMVAPRDVLFSKRKKGSCKPIFPTIQTG